MSPTEYNAECKVFSDALEALKTILPATNGTNGVCGQMNGGLSMILDMGQIERALTTLKYAAPFVSTLQDAPQTCSYLLYFNCDARLSVQETAELLDHYMMTHAERLMTSPDVGSRAGQSMIQTMIAIIESKDLSIDEIGNYSLAAEQFIVQTAAQEIAYSQMGRDIGDLLSELILENADQAEDLEDMFCEALNNGFDKVDELLHKAGLVLSPGMSAIDFVTDAFEARIIATHPNDRAQMSGFGNDISLPGLRYAETGSKDEAVVIVSVHWKAALAACRGVIDLSMRSDVYSVSTFGTGSLANESVAFDAGEYIDMTMMQIPLAGRSAESLDCNAPRECRWWDARNNTWNSTGCSYVAPLHTCRCTHLTEFAVVSPKIVCPPAVDDVNSTGSTIMAVVFSLVSVVLIVGAFMMYRRYKNAKDAKVADASIKHKSSKMTKSGQNWAWKEPSKKELSVGDDDIKESGMELVGMNFAQPPSTESEHSSSTPRRQSSGTSTDAALLPGTPSESARADSKEPFFPESPQEVDGRAALVDLPNSPQSLAAATVVAALSPTLENQPAVAELTSSSESDALSFADSLAVPEFQDQAVEEAKQSIIEKEMQRWIQAQAEGSGSSDVSTSSSEEHNIPREERENIEYIRRCKATFIALTDKYPMEEALERYDEFLERDRQAVLDEPAHLYMGKA